MRGLRVVFAVAVVAAVSWLAPQASAACHAFSFTNTDFQPTEGGTVTVTIERDGAVQDSSVRVQSVNGSATGGTDFTAVNRRVFFTGSQLEGSIQVQTQQDSKDEPNETFQLKLSDGQGCDVNTNFSYGSPATVTIKDDDQAAATAAPTAAPTPAPTQAPTSSPTSSPSPTPTGSSSPTPTASASPSPTTTESFTPVPVEEEDDDGFPWLPVAAVVGFLAAGGGALALMRMRAGV